MDFRNFRIFEKKSENHVNPVLTNSKLTNILKI